MSFSIDDITIDEAVDETIFTLTIDGYINQGSIGEKINNNLIPITGWSGTENVTLDTPYYNLTGTIKTGGIDIGSPNYPFSNIYAGNIFLDGDTATIGKGSIKYRENNFKLSTDKITIGEVKVAEISFDPNKGELGFSTDKITLGGTEGAAISFDPNKGELGFSTDKITLGGAEGGAISFDPNKGELGFSTDKITIGGGVLSYNNSSSGFELPPGSSIGNIPIGSINVSNSSISNIIPVPSYTGEFYIGLNTGVIKNNWNQIQYDIKSNKFLGPDFFPQPSWVQPFGKKYLFWGGNVDSNNGYVWVTDPNGIFQNYYYKINGNTYCNCLGEQLYVGGSFNTVIDYTAGKTVTCNNIFYISYDFSVNPFIDSNGDNGFNDSVYSIRYSKKLGGYYIFGGSFTKTGTSNKTSLNRVAVGVIGKAWFYSNKLGITNGTVYDTIDILNSDLTTSIIIGGSFTDNLGGNIIGFNTKTEVYFSVGSGKPGENFNDSVNVFGIDTQNLYIGGRFTTPSSYYVSVPLSDFTSINSYSYPQIPVISIFSIPNVIYIGGNDSNGNGIVYINGNQVDSNNFTNGLTIGQKGSFNIIEPNTNTIVLVNNKVSTKINPNNGAYINATTTYANFIVDNNTYIVGNSSIKPVPVPVKGDIINSNYTKVSIPNTGDSFTLVGYIDTNSLWYIQSQSGQILFS